jgi:hypothetical protein
MKKSITYELDRPRHLRFGMEAFAEYEGMMNERVIDLDLTKLSMRQTSALAWSGMVKDDAELTVKKVQELVDEYSSIAECTEKIMEAIISAFPGGDEKNVKKA